MCVYVYGSDKRQGVRDKRRTQFFVAIEEEEWWGVAVAVTNQQSACTAAGGFGSGGSVGVVLLLFARLELLWTLSTLLLDKLQAVYCSVLCHFIRAPISFSGGSKHCG